MDTLTLNQIKKNADLLFLNYGEKAVILKNENNQLLLLTPLLAEHIQEITKLYTSTKKQIKKKVLRKKSTSFEEFDKRWCGFLKEEKISDNWKEDYINDKIKKYL